MTRAITSLTGRGSPHGGRSHWLLPLAGALGLAAILAAGASASALTQSAGPPTIAGIASDEWRSLAIRPIADGSRTGERLAAGALVEPLADRPARPAKLRAAAATKAAAPQVLSLTDGPVRVSGIVGADLNAALRAAGVPDGLAMDYIRALATRIDLATGIGVTDRFDLVLDGGRLAYAGLDRIGASDLMLMRWTISGKADWIDANGLGGQTAGMAWPVPPRVSSDFGMRRHPVLGSMRFHRGIDLRAGMGEPIRAAADGQVASAGWAGGHGRQVRISHAAGLATSYSHMSRIAAVPGQLVRQGQVIGYVGSSGLSTGPHLHYEVYKDGRFVDPRNVRFAGASRIEPREAQAFRARLRQLLMLEEREVRAAAVSRGNGLIES